MYLGATTVFGLRSANSSTYRSIWRLCHDSISSQQPDGRIEDNKFEHILKIEVLSTNLNHGRNCKQRWRREINQILKSRSRPGPQKKGLRVQKKIQDSFTARTHTHNITPLHKQTHCGIPTHTNTPTDLDSHTHTHAHTHSRTHTLTFTHTHSPSLTHILSGKGRPWKNKFRYHKVRGKERQLPFAYMRDQTSYTTCADIITTTPSFIVRKYPVNQPPPRAHEHFYAILVWFSVPESRWLPGFFLDSAREEDVK